MEKLIDSNQRKKTQHRIKMISREFPNINRVDIVRNKRKNKKKMSKRKNKKKISKKKNKTMIKMMKMMKGQDETPRRESPYVSISRRENVSISRREKQLEEIRS